MKSVVFLRRIFHSIVAACFPWSTILYLNTIPIYLTQRKQQQPTEIHYLYHVLFLAFFLVFIYALLYANETASFVGMGCGLASVLLFQSSTLCTALSETLHTIIWGIFPYNYLLFNLIGLLYFIGLFVKLWALRNKPIEL
jgi:hypothetical protein